MDRRISYKLVVDTETCPLDREMEGVTPSNMFTYDIGWAVVDKRGNVYKTASYVVADIFLDEQALMKSAYYADKIPNYWKDIREGKRKLATWNTIRKQFINDIKEYNIKQVFAHNMRFDHGTLNNTERWLSKSKYRYFFPYGIEICDTLKMARDVIGKMPSYKRFCKENELMTKNNQCRFTAEALFRFISRNTDFKESHTALEDVLIEKEILRYCYKQKKKMRIHCFS